LCNDGYHDRRGCHRLQAGLRASGSDAVTRDLSRARALLSLLAMAWLLVLIATWLDLRVVRSDSILAVAALTGIIAWVYRDAPVVQLRALLLLFGGSLLAGVVALLRYPDLKPPYRAGAAALSFFGLAMVVWTVKRLRT
jgi:hypothetical protein